MGLDVLDIVFRLEEKFGVAFSATDLDALHPNQSWWCRDFTAGDLHFLIGCKLTEAGRPVPDDIWDRLQTVLAEVIGIDRERIQPQSWVVYGLGAQ